MHMSIDISKSHIDGKLNVTINYHYPSQLDLTEAEIKDLKDIIEKAHAKLLAFLQLSITMPKTT